MLTLETDVFQRCLSAQLAPKALARIAGKTTSCVFLYDLSVVQDLGGRGEATSAMGEMATICCTETANRIGQLETNSISDHAARLDAEQHVTVLLQQAQSSRLVCGKSGKPDVHSYSAWNDWEPVRLPYIDQLAKKLTNAMKELRDA